jgi:hypothetical protein
LRVNFEYYDSTSNKIDHKLVKKEEEQI